MAIPRYECADNPCDEGYWPFEDSDGFMRCFQSKSALSDCRPPSVIQYDNQTEELFIMSAILNQSNKGLQSNAQIERQNFLLYALRRIPNNRKEGRQVKQSSLGAQLRLLRAEQCIGRRPQVSTGLGVVWEEISVYWHFQHLTEACEDYIKYLCLLILFINEHTIQYTIYKYAAQDSLLGRR